MSDISSICNILVYSQFKCIYSGLYLQIYLNFCSVLQIMEEHVHHKNKVNHMTSVFGLDIYSRYICCLCTVQYIWMELLSLQLGPYLGATLQGVVRASLVRGRLVYCEGSFCPKPLGKHLLIPPREHQTWLWTIARNNGSTLPKLCHLCKRKWFPNCFPPTFFFKKTKSTTKTNYFVNVNKWKQKKIMIE